MKKGVTVSSLNKRSNRAVIDSIVQDIVKVIDAQILNTHQSGGNNVKHELPTTFNICNMDVADAQTMIYSELISLYTKPESQGGKGFTNTTIDMGVKTFIYIRWLNGMDKKERENRRQIILSHMLKRNEK